MKKLIQSVIALAALGFVAPASAMEAYPTEHQVSYTLLSHVGGGEQIYYNCQSVRSTVKDILKKLGAEKIRVTCSGGIEQPFPTSAHVRASFVAASSMKNNQAPRKALVKGVTIRDNGSCHLYSETLDALSETIEMEVVSAPRYCRVDTRLRNRFEVNVLAFE